MSLGKQLVLVLLSALLGALLSLGGFLLWQRANPAWRGEAAAIQIGSDGSVPLATFANIPATGAEQLAQGAFGAVGDSTGPADPEEQIVTGVYRRAAPWVVHIKTRTFGMNIFGYTQELGRGSGSGVIINKEGYILTNSHVVRGSEADTQLTVTLHDGKEYEATWQGTDPETDLAVIRLKVPPANLPVAELGTSANLIEGQRAIAIGNPYGLSSSVSVGVMSALNRTVSGEGGGKYEGMIQTDAAVNPGNSGGPLLNSRGQVVGINTVIFSSSGGSQGIAFAIPIDFAKKVVADLVEYGKVRRPYLGVEGIPVTPGVAQQFDMGVTSGVLIQQVVPGSPADIAGLKAGTIPWRFPPNYVILQGGDVILSVAGQRVNTQAELISIIRQMQVDQVVTVEIWRDGETLTKQIQLAAQ